MRRGPSSPHAGSQKKGAASSAAPVRSHGEQIASTRAATPPEQKVRSTLAGGCSNAGVTELQRPRRVQDPTRHWITSFPLLRFAPTVPAAAPLEKGLF